MSFLNLVICRQYAVDEIGSQLQEFWILVVPLCTVRSSSSVRRHSR